MTVLGSSSPSAPATRKKITGHVGFSNLPNQIRRKSFKDGFQLTVMVVGEPGIPRIHLPMSNIRCERGVGLGQNHTDQHSLQLHDLCSERASASSSGQAQDGGYRQHPGWFVYLLLSLHNPIRNLVLADIEENGVRLRLSVVDTPGFGDFVDNSKRCVVHPRIIARHWIFKLNSQLEPYIGGHRAPIRSIPFAGTSRETGEASGQSRPRMCIFYSTHRSLVRPKRCTVHLNLITYFLSLKQIDIEFMQKLHHRVNLIPVIAKADTMTDEDIVDFKARVR
jgi:septin 7